MYLVDPYIICSQLHNGLCSQLAWEMTAVQQNLSVLDKRCAWCYKNGSPDCHPNSNVS